MTEAFVLARMHHAGLCAMMKALLTSYRFQLGKLWRKRLSLFKGTDYGLPGQSIVG